MGFVSTAQTAGECVSNVTHGFMNAQGQFSVTCAVITPSAIGHWQPCSIVQMLIVPPFKMADASNMLLHLCHYRPQQYKKIIIISRN